MKGRVSVAAHLGIELSEYDDRIRTFIPHYHAILDAVARSVSVSRGAAAKIVDLGIGTGALAQRCLARMKRSAVYGIDADPGILAAAGQRLARYGRRLRLRHGDFSRTRLPRCDAVVATLALHHIKSVAAKGRLYQACYAALRPGGVLVNGDVALADTGKDQLGPWRRHMRRSYSLRQTRDYLAAWADEDRYLPLTVEMHLLERAGFEASIAWRRPPFAVMVGRRP